MRWLLPILNTLTWQNVPLAALISLQTLQNALNVLGYPAVTLFIMIESAGIPFPGETMLLFASFYSAIDNHLQIYFIIPCAALGAILGDNIGYFVGRTGGRAFALKFGRYLFIKPHHLDYAERFFARHGDKTVFFGRFISILRAWSAFFAGVNHMPWRKFLFYNAAGGIVWAILYGTLGYIAGHFLHDNFSTVQQIVSTIGWLGAGAIAAVILCIAIFLFVRRKRKRAASNPNVKDTDQVSLEADATPLPVPTGPEEL